jgi:hypothetical protein
MMNRYEQWMSKTTSEFLGKRPLQAQGQRSQSPSASACAERLLTSGGGPSVPVHEQTKKYRGKQCYHTYTQFCWKACNPATLPPTTNWSANKGHILRTAAQVHENLACFHHDSEIISIFTKTPQEHWNFITEHFLKGSSKNLLPFCLRHSSAFYDLSGCCLGTSWGNAVKVP